MHLNHLSVCAAPVILAVAIAPAASAAGADLELVGSDAFTTAIGTINRDTAEWTLIGGAEAVITGMAYDANHDVLYGVSPSTDMLYVIDQSTGKATPVDDHGTLGYDNVNGLAYDPNTDVLYATDNNTNTLMQLDTTTGVGTWLADITGGFTEVEGLGFDPATNILYGITALQSAVITIDVREGTAVAVGDPLPEAVWRGLTWDTQTGYLYLSAVNIFDDADIYMFNPADGRLEFRGHTVGIEAVQGLAVRPVPTAPCPSDVNGDGAVDVLDLLQVLSDWGACP